MCRCFKNVYFLINSVFSCVNFTLTEKLYFFGPKRLCVDLTHHLRLWEQLESDAVECTGLSVHCVWERVIILFQNWASEEHCWNMPQKTVYVFWKFYTATVMLPSPNVGS